VSGGGGARPLAGRPVLGRRFIVDWSGGCASSSVDVRRGRRRPSGAAGALPLPSSDQSQQQQDILTYHVFTMSQIITVQSQQQQDVTTSRLTYQFTPI